MESPLPVKLWGLDPLYWSHVKLFTIDVLKLTNYPEFKGVYAISNHPIVQVLITGYVAKVNRKEKLTIYGVDDGTACLDCCFWKDQHEGSEIIVEANFGDLVTVMGSISEFREERQIIISTLLALKHGKSRLQMPNGVPSVGVASLTCEKEIETDPNVEILHWLQVMELRESYEKPFEVPELFLEKEEANPWQLTDLDVETDKLEEALQTEIREYLESKEMMSFDLTSFYCLNKVMDMSKNIARKREESGIKNEGERKNIHVSKSQIDIVLQRTLRKLQKAGIVHNVRVVGLDYRVFELISIKKDLSPKIVEVIRGICDSEEDPTYGVPTKQIVEKLRTVDRYKRVGSRRVLSSLDHLVTNAYISETSEGHYRVV